MDIGVLTRRWEEIRSATRKMAEAIPPGREGFRPVEGVMSLGEHVLHVVSGERTAVNALSTTPGVWEWKTGLDLEHYPTTVDILRILDEQTERTRAYFSTLTSSDLDRELNLPWGDVWTLDELWFAWMIHETHHRGSVITTLRAAGITPPDIY